MQTIDADQAARLAQLLRQGPMQGQQRSTQNPLTPEMASKIVDFASGLGGSGLPNSSQNAGINAITPDFQSGNYGAPAMNMTGAGNITPSFQSANFMPESGMMQGFNPAMFKGIF